MIRFHLRDRLGLADFQFAFRLNPFAAAAECARFLTEDAQRRPDEVMENAEKHIRIDATDALAHARRGESLCNGRLEEAEPHLARFRELRPDLWDHFRLVITLVQRETNRGRERGLGPVF